MVSSLSIRKRLRQHLTDAVAYTAIATPLGALSETVLSDFVLEGVSDEVSLRSRLIVAGLYFGGMAGVLGHIRDVSKPLFHITETTKERYHQLYGMVYLGGLALIFNPLIYFGAGSRDLKEVATATGIAMGVSFVHGGWSDYAVALFRDLTGYEPSVRIPERLSHARPGVKVAVAGALVAASLGLTALVYQLTPDAQTPVQQPPASSATETLSIDFNPLRHVSKFFF